MRESLKGAEKTRLLEKCSTCGKQVGRLADAPITGWMFSSRCQCPDHFEDASAKSDKAVDSGQSGVEKTDIELPLLPDRYEVLEFLGEGGMGQVFKVRDRESDAIFALKCLSRKLADDKEAVKRFYQEASAVSRLNHPHIISVYGDVETTDHRPCLLMDFIAGGSLKSLLEKKGKLNQKEALDVFVQIAEALQYAHQNELLHRDLKPSNIMLSGTEAGALNAKLVDFGIAKVMPATSGDRDTQDLTRTGEVFGSPAYMSPEQCMGFKLDERSDIYSFGCLMYEALAGQPPFNASNPIEVVVKHLSAQPRPWSNTPEGKPLKGTESLVFRCLAKESDDRYQTVGELLKDLNLLKAGKKIKELSRQDAAKAVLSAGQGGLLIGESIGLVIYWTLVSAPLGGALAIVPALLLPVFSYQLIRHIRRYGLGGSNWKQWRFLCLIAYIVLGVTAIPVFIGTFGKSASLPEVFDQVYAVSLAIQLTFIPIAFATRVGAYLFTGAQKQFRTVCAQFAVVLVPLLILVFTNPGPISIIMPHVQAKMLASHRFGLAWRPRQAIATARLAIAMDPSYVEGHAILARNLNAEKKFEEALAVLDRLKGKALGFEAREIAEQRADAYVELGQLDKALAEMNQAITAEKNENHSEFFLADLLRKRAEIHLERHDYKSALTDFQYADELKSSSYSLLNDELSVAHWMNGDAKKAIDILSKRIDENSRSDKDYATLYPEGFVKRAIIFESLQDFDSARNDYLAVVEGDPDAASERAKQKTTESVFSYERPWWVSLAMPAVDEIVEKNTTDRLAEIRLNRAYAFHKLNDEKASLAELAKAEQLGLKKSDLAANFVNLAGIRLDW